MRSIGFAVDASGETNDASSACVAAERMGTSSPAPSHASDARMPGPPPFETIATRRPGGNGWCTSTCAASSSSASVSTRTTPACRNSASVATSDDASAAVWDAAARVPARDRPLLTARIGLLRPIRRASRANLRGFPNDSR